MKSASYILTILIVFSSEARALNSDPHSYRTAAFAAVGVLTLGASTFICLYKKMPALLSSKSVDQLAALLNALHVQTPEEGIAKIEEQEHSIELARQKLSEATSQLNEIRDFLESCNGAHDINEAHEYIESEVCKLRDNTLSILETLRTYFPDSRIAQAVEEISKSEGELLFDRKVVENLTMQIAIALSEHTRLTNNSLQAIEACMRYEQSKKREEKDTPQARRRDAKKAERAR
jgi:hypothetical protein